MALQKAILSSFDVDVTYWNIGEEHKDFRTGTNRVVVHGFKDSLARTRKAMPITSVTIIIDGANFQPNMSRAEIYEYIKTRVLEFSGSEDV